MLHPKNFIEIIEELEDGEFKIKLISTYTGKEIIGYMTKDEHEMLLHLRKIENTMSNEDYEKLIEMIVLYGETQWNNSANR